MYDQDLVDALVRRDVAEYGPGGRTFENLSRKYYRTATAATAEGRARETYMKIL
jgi:hypothetical protein